MPTAPPTSPCPVPGTSDRGQDSLTIQFVILPPSREREKGGGKKKKKKEKKKKKSHYLYLSFPSASRKCKLGRDSCRELFIFHSEEGVSFILYRDFLFGKKKKSIAFHNDLSGKPGWVAEFQGLLTEH